MSKFIVGNRLNMPRISNDVWDHHKPIIIESYKIMTLDHVIVLMEKEHNFTAS
jgi:hypothetical protein